MSAMDGLRIDEIAGELIKKELFKVVEKRLDSSEIQISVDHACSKGTKLEL